MNVIERVSMEHYAPAPQPRLVQAAHEFEGQLMKELLKPMTNSNSIDEDDKDPESGNALADFGTEALGQALSRDGGLGIAASIFRSLSLNETNSQTSSKTGAGVPVSSKVEAAGSSEVEDSR